MLDPQTIHNWKL